MSIKNNHDKLINSGNYGKWQFATSVDRSFDEYQIGIMSKLDVVEVLERQFVVASFNQEMFDLANLKLVEGRLPQQENEIIIDIELLSAFGKDYYLNSAIEMQIGGASVEFNIVGSYLPITNNWIPIETMGSYPSLITTGHVSDDMWYFGFVDELATTREMETYWFLNHLSYDDLNLEKTIEQYTYQIELEKQEKAIQVGLNGSILILGLFVIFNVFASFYNQMKQQIFRLKLINVSRREVTIFLLTQSLFYALLFFILSLLSIKATELVFNTLFIEEAIVYNMRLIWQNTGTLCFGVFIISSILYSKFIFEPLFGQTEIENIKNIRRNRRLMQLTYLFLITITFSLVLFSSTKILGLDKHKIDQYKTRMSTHPSYTLRAYDQCYRNETDSCGLTKEQLTEIKSIKGIEEILPFSYSVNEVQFDTMNQSETSLFIILDDESLSLLTNSFDICFRMSS